jgi:hypothetical protein
VALALPIPVENAMSRTLACLAVLLAAVPPLAAQTRQPGDPIPLTLTPAAPPAPSLKYRLLPGRRDQVPGNAATLYYRTEALLADNGELLNSIKAPVWSTWAEMPLKELPLDEVGNRLATVRGLLRELDQASRRRDCDWQTAGRPEGIAFLIPDVQGFRSLATVLAVRARDAMARGNFDEAVKALQTGYALAYHMGKGPFLIQVLVGAAIAQVMNNQLDELLQQPETPNLYWALAVLPRPLFDPELALQEEGTMLERSLPFLKRLDQGPMSAAEVKAAKEEMKAFQDKLGLRPQTLPEGLEQIWAEVSAYGEARRALMAQGFTQEQIEAMPPFQVVRLHALREYRRAWEEWVKWYAVPGGWREPGAQKALKELGAAGARLDLLYFRRGIGNLAPALEKIYQAMGRVDRRFAALCCVEAVRLHAAAHDGKLPAKLADITEVPLPPDPVTGMPFVYEVKNGKATLSNPVPPGTKPQPYQMLTYEITLRR